MPRNATKIATLTVSSAYWTREAIHSHATGTGPKNIKLTSTITTRMAAARLLSSRWRRRVPRLGSARYLTGAVPGRRPMNRPPLSVGSVRATLRFYPPEPP
jgi:hypothetical protein